MISVIILTKNEELNLPRCLDSLRFTDDIHVLDSGSEDDTVKIAKSYGANVHSNAFESFGKQRNYALNNIKIKYDWILFLDADEASTPEFENAMKESIAEAGKDVAGFYCCWKLIFEGRWLKHSANFPQWQFRLLKKGRAEFTDFGHGQKEDKVKGKLAYIEEPYLHYGFSKGWYHWIEKHNQYSSLEALDRVKKRPPFKNIFSTTSSIRNPALKSWLSKIPGWPFLRFAHDYFLRLGFLDGLPGFIYCINMAYYEFLVGIKIRENKKQTQK